MWTSEKPDAFVKKILHQQKIGVWCAILRKRVVGLFFFQETLSKERYQSIIKEFIASFEPEERYCWLQEDGTTVHTTETN